jgi:uncharacterized protein YtpQ (UPF0354 family)
MIRGHGVVRQFLALILSWFSLSSSAQSDAVMTAEEFTRAYAAKVEELFPGSKVIIKGALEIDIEMNDAPDAKDLRNYLDNAFREYAEDPGRADEIMRSYISKLVEALGQTDFKREQLVPVVRHKDTMAITFESNPGENHFFGRRLVGDLYVFYAFDAPNTVAYVTKEAIEDLKLSESELEKVAFENYQRLRGELTIETYPALSVVRGTDVFMTSILLVDEFWAAERFRFRGDIVAFVVTRDFMLVTGSDEDKGLESAIKMSREIIRDAPYPISAEPIIRRGGKWLAFVQ